MDATRRQKTRRACRRPPPLGPNRSSSACSRVRSPFVFTLVRDGVGGRVGRGRGRGCDRGRGRAGVRERGARAVHATLAETQWRALADALDAPTPEPPSACALRASVKAFVATHGRLPGSGPFLRGLRVLLEAQGGKPRVVAWRLDPATLTQSGGEAWMRDAVLLLRSGLERREDLEGPPAPAVPPAPASDERQPLPAHLVWSLPAHVSDVDLYKILAKLPDHASLRESGPAGAIVRDAGRDGDPPRDVDPPGFGGDCTPSVGKRRHVCCMIFIVAVACVLAVAVR